VKTNQEEEIYISITGTQFYHGLKPFKLGTIIKLVKDPENFYDAEAIRAEIRYAGQIGYVANNPKTVARGTMSAGRIYDKIMDTDFAKVKFILKDEVICKILNKEELEEEKSNPDSDVNF
jgi:hypothetical protein